MVTRRIDAERMTAQPYLRINILLGLSDFSLSWKPCDQGLLDYLFGVQANMSKSESRSAFAWTQTTGYWISEKSSAQVIDRRPVHTK